MVHQCRVDVRGRGDLPDRRRPVRLRREQRASGVQDLVAGVGIAPAPAGPG